MRLFYFVVMLCALVGMQSVDAQTQAKPKPKLRRAVILMTDIGTDMDDQWALAHLAISPEIDLRGVVTTHAFGLPKPEAEFTAKTAKEVLAKMPISKTPPVFAGSSDALKNDSKGYFNEGVKFLIDQSRPFDKKNRLVVLNIGAATDTASALLLDPGLGDRIEIIAMGFNNYPEGGDEWNIKNDPIAWRVLLNSSAPITVGDGTVTKRDLAMNVKKAKEIFNGCGAAGDYLVGLLDDWFKKHPDLVKTGNWPIWDSVTLAHLLKLTTFEMLDRPRLESDLKFSFTPPLVGIYPTIQWIKTIDAPKLWDDFNAKLKAANVQYAVERGK